jgi:hypothetical protein
MRILPTLRLGRNRARWAAVVDRVAARSKTAVWQRVRDRVTSMSPARARGYIRARSTVIIEREMGIVAVEQADLSAGQRAQIFQQVRERIERQALMDAMRLKSAILAARRVAA